jgi:hypothetical protein
MPSNSPTRPFNNAYLLAYSAEHVVYEFEMFLWLAQICGRGTKIGAPTPEDARRVSNVLIESFAIHVRNLIDFLYLSKPKPTDIVAADFFDPDVWETLRPPISQMLERARIRANKEIAHLTSDRIPGSPPEKAWNFSELANEIRPLLLQFAKNALTTRLSPGVSNVIGL